MLHRTAPNLALCPFLLSFLKDFPDDFTYVLDL
jgi:hypothetical protein